MEQDRKWLEQTLKLAQTSLDFGSAPIGAVIVDSAGDVVSEGRNRAHEPWPLESREIAGSGLAHAEMVALFHIDELDEAGEWTLYCSLEPCLMCGGALGLLGFRRIVWACDDPWGGSGRLIAWREHPAFEGTDVTPHPFEDLENEAARLFAPEAHKAYPQEGWNLWKTRYPEICAEVEADA